MDMESLACNECGYEWEMEPDQDGLFNGRGCPPCPRCHSGVGVSSADYGDFKCLSCGNIFRRYGNGGLHFGMMPRCPECGGFTEELV